jgi:hypothetical protein
MKASLTKFFRHSLPVMVLLTVLPAFAANEIDVYGDAKLHSVEKEIVSLAEASQKDISYQEHQQILDKVSGKIVGSISDVSQLATLAIWAYLNVHSDEIDEQFINYDHVISTAYSYAILRIGKIGTPAAEAALWKVAHQVNIDAHISEELCEAMSKITKKDFHFGDRVYVRFQDPNFQKLPMSPELATFRVALCEEIWSHWKAPVAEPVDVIAKATFVIDADRQFTNIKVVPGYFGKKKNQTVAVQFVEAARSALEKCAVREKLPEGVKKVRVEADFYGR